MKFTLDSAANVESENGAIAEDRAALTQVTGKRVHRSIAPLGDGDEVVDPFRAEATQVLARLRQTVERVVFSVTKVLQNSRTLQTVLRVDLNVSWQMFKLLGPIDTLSTVSYIPAGVSFRKMLTAAKKEGVSEDVLADAAAAFAAFDRLVSDTTGDREQFETAVLSYADSAESAQVGMHYRKAAFKADVHFFGVAVQTLAFALLFHPGAEPGSTDFVGLRQMLGLRRLRASTDLLIERWKLNRDDPENANGVVLGDALDAGAATAHNAAVLPDFCSRPLLPLATEVSEAGDVRTFLRHRDIGVGREVDITTGRIYRDAKVDTTPDGRAAIQGVVEIGRPTRLQVIDTFVHRQTWPKLTPHSGVFAHLLQRRIPNIEQEGVKLPFNEKLQYLGSGPDVARFSESPQYTDLVRHACEKMAWRFEDFDLYRIRIEYPLMDSNVVCRLEAGSPG